ncbi:MAG: hypothetical protein RSF79_24440, partial [Janthinobacterium sp.]
MALRPVAHQVKRRFKALRQEIGAEVIEGKRHLAIGPQQQAMRIQRRQPLPGRHVPALHAAIVAGKALQLRLAEEYRLGFEHHERQLHQEFARIGSHAGVHARLRARRAQQAVQISALVRQLRQQGGKHILGIHLARFLAIRRVQHRQGEALAHVIELAQGHRPLRACRAAIGRARAELEHGKRRHL